MQLFRYVADIADRQPPDITWDTEEGEFCIPTDALAERLFVSKATVRGAFRALEAHGLIECLGYIRCLTSRTFRVAVGWAPQNSVEELLALRRRVAERDDDNARLHHENLHLKDRLEAYEARIADVQQLGKVCEARIAEVQQLRQVYEARIAEVQQQNQQVDAGSNLVPSGFRLGLRPIRGGKA